MSLKNILLQAKLYIEATEEIVDGEWGAGSTVEELIKNGAMPKIYNDICDLLENGIAKKVVDVDRCHCPSCNGYLGCEGFEQYYCDNCGQELDWRRTK